MASAQEAAVVAQAAAPVANKGDIAWLLMCSALVIFMTLPGLALFYGGLVRSKNVLSVLMQCLLVFSLVAVLWVLYGYSLAFTPGNAFVGGWDRLFGHGLTGTSMAPTFTKGVVIPEFVFFVFQGAFACITCALIVGAFAERVKFAGVLVFTVFWFTFAYTPMAHMVWFFPGPDAFTSADAVPGVLAQSGFLFAKGALDFAGGTVVHINAGIAGLMAAFVVGKRVGYGREAMPPHSLTMTLIGASLLWVGWFGFNAGSALEAGGTATLAMINTFVATAAAALAWLLAEKIFKGKPSLLGAASGAVAGLVAVTPASGFAGPMGAIVLGLVAGFVCMFFCSAVKNALGYDDSLDVFGVHCIGGILGAIGTGFLAAPSLGGTSWYDYTIDKVAEYDMTAQVITQCKAVALTLVWSGVGSLILLLIVKVIVGLRPGTDQEREGLDLVDHGERAYNY
jgi:Amt family ammonium transporter